SDSHAPDLVVSVPPMVAPLTVGTGATVSLTGMKVKNAGDQAVPASADVPYHVYLSTNNVIEPDLDIQLTSGGNPYNPSFQTLLSPGAEIPLADVTVDIPKGLTPGTYYIGVFVDDSNPPVVAEVTVNNFSVQALTILPGGNLVVSSVPAPPAASPANLTTGQTTSATSTIANASPGTEDISTPSIAGIFLSTDAVLSIDDALIGTSPVPPLPAHASIPKTTTVTIPNAIAPGNYFLIVQ